MANLRIPLVCCALTALLMGLATPAYAVLPKTVTLVADVWCPFNCEPDSDKPGVIIEIAKRAFALHGITVDYKIVPWARAIEETRNGKYNGIVGAARGDAEDFVFPETPQSKSVMTFFVRKDSPWRYNGPQSLESISLGSIVDYSYGEEVDAYIERHKSDMRRIQQVSGDNALDMNIRKLVKGRIGATIDSDSVIAYHLAAAYLQNELVPAGSLDADDDQNLHVAFSPKIPASKELAKILSDETKRMRQDGEYAEILKRYNLEAEPEAPAGPAAEVPQTEAKPEATAQ